MQKPGWSNAAFFLRKSACAVSPGRVATREPCGHQSVHPALFEQDGEDPLAWLIEDGLLLP